MAGRKMIKNHGMLISVFIHILILSIPFSTTMTSLSGQGVGDIEISIADSSVPAISPAKNIISPAIKKAVVVKKETTEQRDSEVKVPQKKEPEATTADKAPGKEAAEAETDTARLKPAAEEDTPETADQEVREPGEDSAESLPQGVLHADAGERPVSRQQYAMPVSVPPGKPHVTAFGSAEGPGFLRRVIPEYPRMARRLGKEGRVLLRLVIDETGRLVHAEVVEKAGFGFDREAMEAVRNSVFLPARKNGIPVKSEVLLPVKFVLKRR
ncbi:MAG: energy transducer TonB [Deferribacteres bacterium]|nr:energy transducer TonB [Deferribacteres bacterium]